MPKRQTIKHVKSPVQGTDSFVEFRELTWGEQKDLAKQRQEIDDDIDKATQLTEKLLVDHVANWNWLDDDNTPLPLPKDDPTVIDRLNDDEIKFLANHFTTDNSPKS